jgi:hypothetical protein
MPAIQPLKTTAARNADRIVGRFPEISRRRAQRQKIVSCDTTLPLLGRSLTADRRQSPQASRRVSDPPWWGDPTTDNEQRTLPEFNYSRQNPDKHGPARELLNESPQRNLSEKLFTCRIAAPADRCQPTADSHERRTTDNPQIQRRYNTRMDEKRRSHHPVVEHYFRRDKT